MMRRRFRATARELARLLLASSLFACGASSPTPGAPPGPSAVAPPASATPVATAIAREPDPPMPSLRTGAIAPIDLKQQVEGRVVARHLDDAIETLAIEVTLPSELADSGWGASPVVVSVDGPAPAPYSFVAESIAPSGPGRPFDRSARTLWIRRPRAAAGAPVSGKLHGPQVGDAPGVTARFQAPAAPAAVKSDPATLARWAKAFGARLGSDRGPFAPFAAERLARLYPEKTKKPSMPARGRGPAPTPIRATGELGRMMETTTGVASIQEALQGDRPLLLALAREKPSVPVGKLALPKSEPHPWDDLLATVGSAPPKEPLAGVVPAEFWFLRAADLGVIFRLADELDRWATPAVDALDGRAEERELSGRYEAELGLGRSAIGRALGPEVVAEVALVGSDPYLREGSDLTAIFRLKSRVAFEAALAAALAEHGARHGGVTTATIELAGVDVRVATSADGAVRQHRAVLDDLAFVSNSPGALGRVLEAAKGKRARLADEKDFRYMLARDAGVRADALGFMGDRFVAEVVGPRQKVLEARRQIALAELQTPALAALLHGFLYGASPASTDALVKTGLLDKTELAHAHGGAITFRPGEAPRSALGVPGALAPLADQPPPELVTPTEKEAYEAFARTYESYWSRYIDPAALRVAIEPEGQGARLRAELRVMPLIDASRYHEVLDVVGTTRLDVPPLAAGARTTLALGDDVGLRRDLSRAARMFTGRHDVDLDWLGDWAMLGVLDRTPVAVAVHELERGLPERPPTDAERESRRDRDAVALAARAPVYAAIAVRSPVAAGLALAAARTIAEDALPRMLSWGELGKHRDVPIVRVAFDESRGEGPEHGARRAPDVTLYYALARGAFVIALDEGALTGVLDELLDGRAPKAAPAGSPTATQHVIDLRADSDGALFTVLSWLLEGEVIDASDRSRAAAEVLLRGAPERRDPAAMRALGLAYLGAAPMPPDGGAYTLADDGVRDPARGTAHAPLWPAVPVPGSPVAKLLGAVRAFRSELSVEREGPARRERALQSLHVRLELGLAAP